MGEDRRVNKSLKLVKKLHFLSFGIMNQFSLS